MTQEEIASAREAYDKKREEAREQDPAAVIKKKLKEGDVVRKKAKGTGFVDDSDSDTEKSEDGDSKPTKKQKKET